MSVMHVIRLVLTLTMIPMCLQPAWASTSLEDTRLLAELGDPAAQHNMGVMHESGEGVPQDDKEAVRWYRLSAAQGAAYAQTNLGLMYGEGRGVDKDYQEAIRWFRLAAEEGLLPHNIT
jgi:TPR repeat protein